MREYRIPVDPIVRTLRYRRLTNRVSVRTRAEQIGVSPGSVSAYELGKMSPSLAVLRKMAAAEGLDIVLMERIT